MRRPNRRGVGRVGRVLGKDGRSSHEHQMGSRAPMYVVQPHREGQACRVGFQTEGKESMFAAMQPFKTKELLFRVCAKEPLVDREQKWQRQKLMFIDVKKAHLNGKVQKGQFAFVRLPDGKIWQLKCERFVRFCVPTNTHAHFGYETQNEGYGTRA